LEYALPAGKLGAAAALAHATALTHAAALAHAAALPHTVTSIHAGASFGVKVTLGSGRKLHAVGVYQAITQALASL
jgi:hypothetical protein